MKRTHTIPVLIVALFLLGTSASAYGGISLSIGLHSHSQHRPPGHRAHAPVKLQHHQRTLYRHHPGLFRHESRFWRHTRPYHPGRQASVVITAPCHKKVIVAPPCHKSRTIVIWITNSNGSQTEVILTRKGCGYLGPRGEYYPARPTHKQLRCVYGF